MSARILSLHVLRIVMALAVLALLAGVGSAQAAPSATWTVTKLDDTNDGTCNADCSLREAIAAAGAGDSIGFNAGLNGAIYLDPALGTLQLTRNVTVDGVGAKISISGQQTMRVFRVSGGGVSVTLRNLAIQEGYDPTWGGGLLVVTSSVTVENVTFTENFAYQGGAIETQGTLIVRNSTFTNNISTYGGGGLSVNNGGTATLENCTFSGNTASDGYANGSDIFSIRTLNIANTIMANPPGSSPNCANSGGGTAANNVIEVNSGCGATFSNADPGLGPLGDYGGWTPTIPLTVGSIALNNGASCLGLDQRGVSRPVGAGCDIGAYEMDAYTAVSSDNWGTDATWDRNSVPPNWADVMISDGYTVTVETHYTAASLSLDGVLSVPLGSELTVTGYMLSTGTVEMTRTVNATVDPFNFEIPGGDFVPAYRLVSLTTENNLGDTMVRVRALQPGEACTTSPGSAAYALRCYDINPAEDNLPATVRLWALTSELNSIPLADLKVYRFVSPNWVPLDNVYTDAVDNYVSVEGDTPGFSSFLLGGPTAPTAVRFIQVEARTSQPAVWVALPAAALALLGIIAFRRRR